MWGFGDIGGALIPPTATTYFGWGYGDPDPDVLFDAAGGALTWAGTEVDWGFGDEAQLEADHILWMSSQLMPDDGGEIVELRAEWPEIGPWTINLVQKFTSVVFPQADAPLPFCNSPVPGNAEKCFTNTVEVEELGMLVTKPGAVLRFVLPVLPPGAYNVQIKTAIPGLLGTAILLEDVCEVTWRPRALETYTFRRRFPRIYSLGVREISTEPLLGVHADADGDEGAP